MMANKILRFPVFPKALQSAYGTQAAVNIQTDHALTSGQKPQVTQLPKGGVVLSLENNAPVSSIAIFFKAGPRYENVRNAGVSQKLRLCAGLKTKEVTAFMHARRTQEFGACLYSSVGRETISYGLTSAMRDDLELPFTHLLNVATQPLFRPWELVDQLGRLHFEQSIVTDPMGIALDMLHVAAFHSSGLGNSLKIPKYNTAEITDSELQAFWNNTHSSQRMAVVGLGVDHEDLVLLASKIDCQATGNINVPSTYSGGELRKETDGPLAYVTLAGPGASIGSSDAAALMVAQFLLGNPAGTKYGGNAGSKIGNAIAKVGGSGYGAALNINYSDSGLFGFWIVESAEKAGEVAKAVAKVVRTLKITEQELKTAKRKAKAALLIGAEDSANIIEDLGQSALFLGKYEVPVDAAAHLEKVTISSVQSALSKVTKGKPCMGSYGGVSNVPYLDQF